MAEVLTIENGQNVARKPHPWQRENKIALTRMKLLYVNGQYADVITYIENLFFFFSKPFCKNVTLNHYFTIMFVISKK